MFSLLGFVLGGTLGVVIPYIMSRMDDDPSMGGAYCAMLFFSVPFGLVLGTMVGALIQSYFFK